MSDWPTETTERIEQTVALVRDKTVTPARAATKAVVYGLLTFFFIAAAVFLLALAVFRSLDAYLPGSTWSAWLVLGGIFVVAGGFCWSRRSA